MTSLLLPVPWDFKRMDSTGSFGQIPPRGHIQGHIVFVPKKKDNDLAIGGTERCTRETIITHHFTMGIGKPSTVQTSLTEVFSYTVCDLSLTKNCGPLIIGPSYTYLSSLFFFIYPESVSINLFEWHKKSLLDRCEFGYEGKSRGSYHFLHMDVCFVLISLLHCLWAKDKKRSQTYSRGFLYTFTICQEAVSSAAFT